MICLLREVWMRYEVRLDVLNVHRQSRVEKRKERLVL